MIEAEYGDWAEIALREGRRVEERWRVIRMVSYRFTGTCYKGRNYLRGASRK
jgi:hypothetical protein